MAVPLKMTQIKTLRTGGRVDGITLRGPRGPKNNLLENLATRSPTGISKKMRPPGGDSCIAFPLGIYQYESFSLKSIQRRFPHLGGANALAKVKAS